MKSESRRKGCAIRGLLVALSLAASGSVARAETASQVLGGWSSAFSSGMTAGETNGSVATDLLPISIPPNSAWTPLPLLEQVMERPTDSRELWLKTTLPRGTWSAPTLYLHRVRQKFEAYVDGKLIYRFGQLGSRDEPAYLGEPVHLIELPRAAADQELVLRVYSEGARLGIGAPARIGERSSLLMSIVREDLAGLLSGSVSLCIGLGLLLLIGLNQRRRAATAFGAFCVGYGVYALAHTRLFPLLLPYPLAIDYLQYLCTYMTPFAFIVFTDQVLDGLHFEKLKPLRWYFPGLAVLVVTSAAIGIYDLDRSLLLFQAPLVACAIWLSIEVILKARQGAKGAKLFAAGVGLVCATTIHDVLVERLLLPWSVELVAPGTLTFLAILSSLMAMKLGEDARRRIILHKELETAGILQTRFLPARFLADESFELSAYNRSADMVGGDWYAYRIFQKRWLQVHIGDVTGHGTRSALLAAFAKGAVDFYYEDCERQKIRKPAIDTLHTLLNNALFEMGKNEATMTLASLSIDLLTGEVEYTNSGHLAPMLCRNDSSRLISLPGRNDNILGLDRSFVSKPPFTEMLRGDETILIHSDGVYELFEIEGETARLGARRAMEFMRGHFATNGEIRLEDHDLFERIPAKMANLADDVTLIAIKLKMSTVKRRAA